MIADSRWCPVKWCPKCKPTKEEFEKEAKITKIDIAIHADYYQDTDGRIKLKKPCECERELLLSGRCNLC